MKSLIPDASPTSLVFLPLALREVDPPIDFLFDLVLKPHRIGFGCISKRTRCEEQNHNSEHLILHGSLIRVSTTWHRFLADFSGRR